MDSSQRPWCGSRVGKPAAPDLEGDSVSDRRGTYLVLCWVREDTQEVLVLRIEHRTGRSSVANGIANRAISTIWHVSAPAGRGGWTEQHELSVPGRRGTHDHEALSPTDKRLGFESLRAHPRTCRSQA